MCDPPFVRSRAEVADPKGKIQMSESEVVDSPSGWVAAHIKRYVETDGAEGHEWRGVPTLLLTTTGRTSGLRRRTALIYGRDGDRVVVVASKGGSPDNPLWFGNLVADPSVDVQIGAEKFTATARPATAQERPGLWQLMTGIWPAYDEYQTKTDREIPVVVLERS
jgi:deazaflavin-dependent oxidoreductase (nitroreductase family)